MSRGFPSMTALLGLLAVAGYQNREKIAGNAAGVRVQSNAAPRSAEHHGAATGRIEQRARKAGQHLRRCERRWDF